MKLSVAKLISLSVILTLIPGTVHAEQLKRYKITYPDGTFVMNAGTTNPVVIEGYPSVYSTLIFYHDPSGSNNALCAAGCRPVLDSYQNDVTEGIPTSTETTIASSSPAPIIQPSQSSTPVSDKGALAGLEIELYSVSQNDFQWTLNAIANNTKVITYSNFSYNWNAVGPAGIVDSGNSGSSNLIESSQGQIASFHLKNLKPGTSYLISVSATNAGINYITSRTITTKNSIIYPGTSLVDSTTSTKDTGTVTIETKTVNSKIEPISSLLTQDTITLSSISDTQTINLVVSNLSPTEKEKQLQIALKNDKTSIITISTEFAGAPLKITATRRGYKSININISTDTNGDAQLKTTKNLSGFTVVLSIGKVKLDTDIVRK